MQFLISPSNHADGDEGFTLTEMIIVLVIIGLLAAVAVPIFSNILEDARKKTDEANMTAIETAVETYEAKTGHLPAVSAASGTNAAYVKLIALLKKENYIRSKATQDLAAKEKGKIFVYNSASGEVALNRAP
ncbi:prepilin-type N-terminal cleavage/methylation domain-containing protein [Pseudoramibacter faecis]|uniref:type II secretion system protein n=1 Tax=Pseudoramibacter faecis TaxID=3108534 RepID=UPI002E791541|nr:prepilin-type N-terminal cleavage/methylation domain-containing protein [Pseudoramibacter sp. HA2172]